MAKEREDKKIPVKVDEEQDDIPLFYSDVMLLLVSCKKISLLINATTNEALLIFNVGQFH